MMSWGTNDAVLKSTEANGEDKSIKTDPEGSVFLLCIFVRGGKGVNHTWQPEGLIKYLGLVYE